MVVSGATNATPIVITTTTDHARVTGDKVTIAGVTGNTAANGDWTITKLTDDTFSLDTSVGNGAYAANGTVVYNIDETEQLMKTVWATGEASGVSFSLVNAPSGFSIIPTGSNTGSNRHRTTMTCQPPEQGALPKVVTVRVRAKDGVNTVDKVVSFNITDLNHAPDLWDDGNVIEYEKNIFQQISILFHSRDQDIPNQTLTYSLDATAGPYPNLGQNGYDGTPEGDALPSGAAISSAGRLTWTPSTVGTTYITVRVTDNGTPNMDAIWTIKVTVADVFQPGDCTNTFGAPHADITHSSETVTFESFRAFDSVSTSPGWKPSGAAPQWIKHRFSSGAKVVRHVTILGTMTSAAFTIEGSNDDAAWTTLGTWSNKTAAGTTQVFDTRNRTSYEYYRITFTAFTGTLDIFDIELDCNIDEGQIFAITDGGTSGYDTETDDKLVTVNTDTGALTLIGTISGLVANTTQIVGLAIDYRNETTGATTAYLIGRRSADFQLYTLNLETAAVTLVGTNFGSTSLGTIIGACFDYGNSKGLYVLQGATYHRLNVATGAISSSDDWSNETTREIVAFASRSGDRLALASDGQYEDSRLDLGSKTGNNLWQIDHNLSSLTPQGNRARLMDLTYQQSEAYAAMCVRDTADMATDNVMWIFEDGDDDNLNIWKLTILEGEKTVAATYDQTVHGKVTHAAAPYRMRVFMPPVKEFELVKLGVRGWPIGKFSSGDLAQDSQMTVHTRTTWDWQVKDRDTNEELDSGSVAAGSTGTPMAFTTTGILAPSAPSSLWNRWFNINAQSTSTTWDPAPPDYVSPDLRWFHQDFLRTIASAKIYRGTPLPGTHPSYPGNLDHGTISIAIEDAPGLIDGSVTYSVGPMDWVVIELSELTLFNYLYVNGPPRGGGNLSISSPHTQFQVQCWQALVSDPFYAQKNNGIWSSVRYYTPDYPSNGNAGNGSGSRPHYTHQEPRTGHILKDWNFTGWNRAWGIQNKETRHGLAGYGKFIAFHVYYEYGAFKGPREITHVQVGY